MAKLMIALGIVLILGGIWWEFGGTFRPGNLPGDFGFTHGNVRFYFPLGTSLLLSVVLTLVLSWMGRR